MPMPSKSKTLSGITDMTLVAPVRRGLIPALDTRSYASRAALVMRTLNTMRLSSREAQPTPLVTDLVDRVQVIHSFRCAVIDTDQATPRVVLNVVFDGGWEPYMRVIWRDLGPLLDVIFCNCEDYRISTEHTYAEYIAWVRQAQVETNFFYTAAPVTVADIDYLRGREHERVTGAPPPARASATSLHQLIAEAMPALVSLYRLSEMHPHDPAKPREGDGGCLLRAAWRLLGHLPKGLLERGVFEQATRLPKFAEDLAAAKSDARWTPSEKAALAWFYSAGPNPEDPKEPDPPAAAPPPAPAADRTRVQGGILESYARVTHGCVLLIGLDDSAAGQALLDHLLDTLHVSTSRDAFLERRSTNINIAFTPRGLRTLGVPAGTMATLPAEFLEGMAARAGVLGDVDTNHPTRWRLPEGRHVARLPIELSMVDAAVVIHHAGGLSSVWTDFSAHPLNAAVTAFEAAMKGRGVRVLAVQPLQRYGPKEAFGFDDGLSQPKVDAPVGDRDRVALGDVLLGYPNSQGDQAALTGRLWDDGSFLVLRRLRQDVGEFDKAATTKDAKTALMGRSPDGRVLDPTTRVPYPDNNFHYGADPDGKSCPLASHIRRANPRRTALPGTPGAPRIVRRGLSFGPRDGSGECGLLFMAYNASIAEQFEVIQGWLAGGNSSGPGSYSGQRDPFVGVPLPGDPRAFTYGAQQPVALPGKPFATLDWGLYLFAPSLPALDELRMVAKEAAELDAATGTTSRKGAERARRQRDERSVAVQKGAAAIRGLQQAEKLLPLEAARDLWKTALEDISARMVGRSAAVWAAVTDVHGGVLRTPYGVLVGGESFVKEVLSNSDRYTATGYNDRLGQSFGKILLGMDDTGTGCEYRHLAGPIDAALMAVSVDDAFDRAYNATRKVVDALLPLDDTERRVEIRDLVDPVLAQLCTHWFGIPDGAHVVAGGWHWRARATCPGHFGAPSRYTFQANPGPEATRVGRDHGQVLRQAVKLALPGLLYGPPRPVLQAIEQATADEGERVASLVGVMMGFLPTVDGNLRSVLWDWIDDGALWRQQLELLADLGTLPPAAANVLPIALTRLTDPLARALVQRPVPDMVWRTAKTGHDLAGVRIAPGDTVIAGLVGAAQGKRAQGETDASFIFGGYRGGDGTTPSAPVRDAMGGTPWTPQPTHACPGYRMAWGVMLGFIAGLVCSARLRPTLTAAAVQISRLPHHPTIPTPPTPASPAAPAPGATSSPA